MRRVTRQSASNYTRVIRVSAEGGRPLHFFFGKERNTGMAAYPISDPRVKACSSCLRLIGVALSSEFTQESLGYHMCGSIS